MLHLLSQTRISTLRLSATTLLHRLLLQLPHLRIFDASHLVDLSDSFGCKLATLKLGLAQLRSSLLRYLLLMLGEFLHT